MTSHDYAHHFSSKNVPFGIASSVEHSNPSAVTRIENTIIFLEDLAHAGYFKDLNLPEHVFAQPTLNNFAALPRQTVNEVRRVVREAVEEKGLSSLPTESVEDLSQVTMRMPVEVKDFTDFSCSLHHNANMGRLFQNDPTPPPSFYHYPGGYGGRAASVAISGAPVERPVANYYDMSAQTEPGKPKPVVFGPSQMMDYELEFAAIIGKPLAMRQRLNAVDADEHIFGFVLLNDWSARDVQILEMRPLGPFNSKNLGTSISPWVVTPGALEAFQARGPERAQPVASYLQDPEEKTYDVTMQVEILPRGQKHGAVTGTANVQSLYWSARQMIAHVVSAGSALRTGDLMATGTVSGPGAGSHGCLAEATQGGAVSVSVGDGMERRFLLDGDVVRMTAVAGGPDSGVGFGECVGEVLPARPFA